MFSAFLHFGVKCISSCEMIVVVYDSWLFKKKSTLDQKNGQPLFISFIYILKVAFVVETQPLETLMSSSEEVSSWSGMDGQGDR